jgi:3-phosphoshikimate 1-carboxyvinyltransferase
MPGSKSVTNRALVLSALTAGRCDVRRPLRSRDTELMAAALRGLGVLVVDDGDSWVVTGGPLRAPAHSVDVGNAGTVARFIPPVAALATGDVRIDGDPRIRERPVGPLVEALRAFGVTIEASLRGGLPLVVRGTGEVTGGSVTLDASASSQFVSGLLLAAPRYATGVDVTHVGPPLPSAPHIEMTVAMLRAAGAVVDDATANRWHVAAGELRPHDWTIEPDLSSAAPFLAAAAATGGRVRIPDWPATTTQPGALLPGFLQMMGADAQRDDDALTLTGPDRLVGLDADLRACGELTPVLAALAALAATPSRLTGVAHLRRHETDRLGALTKEINALGGDVAEVEDGLVIRPGTLHGGVFATYDDHRMAMAAAVLGLVTPGVLIENVATTDKTLPSFAAMWTAMLDPEEEPT